MTLEDLPNGFVVPTRSEIRDRFQRDYALRQPGAPTGEGSQAFIDGSVEADILAPMYANAISVARGGDLDFMTRAQLKSKARALGIPEELPASGASGFVIITASAGGVLISTSRQLKDEARNLLFHCAVEATYFDGDAVPIVGDSTGPLTNLAEGARLKWTNPPPGLGGIATVQGDANGDGLTGGRSEETDDDIRERVRTAQAEQSAGGNVAKIRSLVKEAGRDLGIAIQEVFVYPAILGPGTYAYVFTLRPGNIGSTRIPDATQIAAVRAYLENAPEGRLPADDGILASEIVEELVTAKLGMRWAVGATGWTDAQPWPIYADAFYVETVTSAVVFRVRSAAAAPTAPQAGRTMAFYSTSARAHVRKRILSATAVGGGSYDIIVDVSNNASDANYLPIVGEEFCPYSDSLALLVDPLLSHVDALGPGEQDPGPFDEGARRKRMPEDPVEWPSELRHKDLDDVDDLPQVGDAIWLEPTMPRIPSVGVPGVSSTILLINRVLAFPM